MVQEETPICTTLIYYYRFPARRTRWANVQNVVYVGEHLSGAKIIVVTQQKQFLPTVQHDCQASGANSDTWGRISIKWFVSIPPLGDTVSAACRPQHLWGGKEGGVREGEGGKEREGREEGWEGRDGWGERLDFNKI